jgi:hypothetical protein
MSLPPLTKSLGANFAAVAALFAAAERRSLLVSPAPKSITPSQQLDSSSGLPLTESNIQVEGISPITLTIPPLGPNTTNDVSSATELVGFWSDHRDCYFFMFISCSSWSTTVGAAPSFTLAEVGLPTFSPGHYILSASSLKHFSTVTKNYELVHAFSPEELVAASFMPSRIVYARFTKQ